MRKRLLTLGEPAPWFSAPTTANPNFHFDTVGGRYVVLCFFESAARPDSRRILDDLWQARERFSDDTITFFGISHDPLDKEQARVQEQIPGLRYFWDFDRSISKEFGAVQLDPQTGLQKFVAHTVVLDSRLRTLAAIPFDDPSTYVTRLLQLIDSLPPLGQPRLADVQAPVMIVPRIFEPEFCRKLISLYDQHGGTESGFMREVNGKTVGMYDHGHKRRQDWEMHEVEHAELRKACMVRIHDRLVPEIEKAYQFKATRMERYIVACYDGTQNAHFRAHRDNTTKGTAHRKFAVSLVLNTGEFDGGFVWFPEYGRQMFAPPAGGAVVFSCSLLHEATPVTRGKRYVFLPFLYDDAAARIREDNLRYVAGDANTPQQAQQAAG